MKLVLYAAAGFILCLCGVKAQTAGGSTSATQSSTIFTQTEHFSILSAESLVSDASDEPMRNSIFHSNSTTMMTGATQDTPSYTAPQEQKLVQPQEPAESNITVPIFIPPTTGCPTTRCDCASQQKDNSAHLLSTVVMMAAIIGVLLVILVVSVWYSRQRVIVPMKRKHKAALTALTSSSSCDGSATCEMFDNPTRIQQRASAVSSCTIPSFNSATNNHEWDGDEALYEPVKGQETSGRPLPEVPLQRSHDMYAAENNRQVQRGKQYARLSRGQNGTMEYIAEDHRERNTNPHYGIP